MFKAFGYGAILFISIVLTSCSDINIFPITSDTSIGELFDENFSEQVTIINPEQFPELYNKVESIKNKLLNSGIVKHKNEFVWKLRIVNNDSIINAFCSPGGYIYVYTGLIKFLESTDELAGVLGHEIAHADLRHTTQQLTKTLGLKVILFLFGLNDNLFTDVAQNLVGLSFSRKHEEEADRYSVACLSKTTYNPVAFINFFKKLQVKEKDNLTAFQFLSTHPNPKNRTEYIMQYAQELKCKLNTENKEDYKVFVAMVNKVQNKLTSKKYHH